MPTLADPTKPPSNETWHWTDVSITKQANEQLVTLLEGTEVQEGDVSAKFAPGKKDQYFSSVDVGQRKNKVFIFFEPQTLKLNFVGSSPDFEDVNGVLSLIDIDSTESTTDWGWDIDVHGSAAGTQPIKALVQKQLYPKTLAIFEDLVPMLLKTHAGKVQGTPGVDPAAGFAKARVYPEKQAVAAAVTTKSKPTKTGGLVNTTTITDSVEFRTPAVEAYKVFVDPARIAAFTRAPPKVFEGAHKGGKFELFGGNVSGEYLELDEPKRIVQSWRLQQWPEGHYSTLNINFDQDDANHVTNMRVTWEGVPIGQEDSTKENWSEYYVKSIKQTFGFGTYL